VTQGDIREILAEVSTLRTRVDGLEKTQERRFELLRKGLETVSDETHAIHERLRVVHAVDDSQNIALRSVDARLSKRDKGALIGIFAAIQVAAELVRPYVATPPEPPAHVAPAVQAAPAPSAKGL
jgi:hypothetical protein